MDRRRLPVSLERLLRRGNHEQLVEAQCLTGVLRDENVPHVRRIETAAEEPKSHRRVDQRPPGPGRANSAGVRAVTAAGPDAPSETTGEAWPTFLVAVSLGAAPQASETSASPG